MEQENQRQMPQDPLLNIFQEGTEEFIYYQRQKGEGYKTKAERQRQKRERLQQFFNSEEHRKQRNHQRRRAEKSKVQKIMSTMTQEEIKQYKKDQRQKRKGQKQKAKQAMLSGQVVMIDLVYEDRMNSKENKSLAKQIQLIMKVLKHIDDPPSIHLCSLGGMVQVHLQKMGYQYWTVTNHTEDILEVGQKLGKKLVYLSPDAEQPLQKVQKDTAYILGGLIDRSIIKNASANRARDLGIETKRLPIRQYMKNRIVLNLDHVVSMVMNYRQTNDWKKSFDFAAPKRWKKDDEGKEKDQEQKIEKISEDSEQVQKAQEKC